MKGQKVFTALYDWMLQEYQRQGVTSGKDLVMPVRTVWGWYMKGQGLQNGQRVDESETGHGLMCIVSNAACIRREVPKVDRLVVMADDEVHPTFRVRAEQWIGEEVVYICDVANHPTDAERVAICAVPRAFLDSLMPSEKNEGVDSDAAPEAAETSPIEVTENEDGTINFAIETVAGPRMAEPEIIGMEAVKQIAELAAGQVDVMHEVSPETIADVTAVPSPVPMPSYQERKDKTSAMTSEKNEGSEKPLPAPRVKPRVSPRVKKAASAPSVDRGLFDDLLFEFAKSCHDSEFRCERSAWTGRYVQYYTTSDIKTLWCVGLMVITFVYYFWADWMLDNTDPLELDVVTVFAPFGVAFLVWSLFVLWLNNRVDEIRKGKKK